MLFRDFRFAAKPCADKEFEELLRLIAKHANPSQMAVKYGKAPAIGTFPNLVAKLCLYSHTVSLSERKKIICFVTSEALYSVASFTLSQPVHLEAPERRYVMNQFNDLVKRVLLAFAAWCRSWNAMPRCDIPAEEAVKQLCSEAYSAPNQTKVQWRFLVSAFGTIPEFWSFGRSDDSTPEHSSASLGGKDKVPEVSNAAPFAQLEENSVVSDAQPMAIDDGVLGSPSDLPHSFDFNLTPGISNVRFSSYQSFEKLAFGADTHAEDLGGDAAATFPTLPVTPTSEVPATSSAASMTSVGTSVVPDSLSMLPEHEHLSTLLSTFGVLPVLPSSELSRLLHAALESKEKFKSADCEALDDLTARVLGRLHEFKRVHGDFVKGLWKFVSEAKQWNTWGLEVQYFHLRYGVALPPEFLSEYKHMSVFVNGFTILVYQLLHQQAGFQPTKA